MYKPLAALTLAIGLSTPAAAAVIVSTSFGSSVSGIPDGYGVVAADNWLEFSADDFAGTGTKTPSNVEASDGTATTVDLVSSSAVQSFDSTYNGTPLRQGFMSGNGAGQTGSVTVSDLNATFTDGYYVIAYLAATDSESGTAVFNDGTPESITFTSPATPDATLNEVTATDPNGNYTIFGSESSPLTADSFTLTVTNGSAGRTGLGGLQIVAVPEPGSLALIGLGIGMIGLRRRTAR
jgi:hypothetical protein